MQPSLFNDICILSFFCGLILLQLTVLQHLVVVQKWYSGYVAPKQDTKGYFIILALKKSYTETKLPLF